MDLINTIAKKFFGPLAKKIAKRFGISEQQAMMIITVAIPIIIRMLKKGARKSARRTPKGTRNIR